jgi:nucleotide-binding universal stress UspA family protein
MAFHRVLVPVDLSEDNLRAVTVAAELGAAGADGAIVLLHVIETIDDAPEDEMRDFYGPLEERARATMEALAAGLAGRPLEIERRVAYGKRLPQILAAAADCRADLVVLRSHRVEPGRPGGGLGTLSHEVALLAEIPVLLVK